jgi:hypothetical protein
VAIRYETGYPGVRISSDYGLVRMMVASRNLFFIKIMSLFPDVELPTGIRGRRAAAQPNGKFERGKMR